MPGRSPAADQLLLLRAFVDELARCGVAGAATSPGSRNTPIVLALTDDDRVPTWSHVDERSGAFFALGVAKATGRTVVVTCTSGTAAANYAPAVHEARQAGVPLIVLTADRPAELRDVGAGQVIDQTKLFGDAARWFVDVGTHEATPARIAWMRSLACRAVWTATEHGGGVVHLNWPLREPLIPDEEVPAAPGGRPDGRPWLSRSRATAGSDAAATAAQLAPIVAAAQRGVVCGRHEARRPPLGPAVAAFAAAAGWPVLADPLSGARTGPEAIAHYDLLLQQEAFARAASPDVVLRVGDLPTSKPLRAWLAQADAVQVALDPDGRWQDPADVVDLSVPAEPVAALTALAAAVPARTDASPALAGWLRADALAADALRASLGDALTEPRLAHELGAHLPTEATLVVSASMPIRDVETAFPVRDAPPRVLSNRGANGIDGVVSTAFGVAAGSAGPVVCLLGDVALAHDVGGLLSARRLRLPLTIVLVDNEGGGIFDGLAIARTKPRARYEEHIATPTGLDFADLAGAYGLTYRPVADVAGLRAALDAGLAHDGTTLIHLHVDRGHARRLRAELVRAVGLALTGG